MVTVRGGYAYDADAVSRETGVSFVDAQDMAIQSAKEECDINVLVKRFGVTGQLPTGVRPPTYGDFTGVMDYQQAQNALIVAKQAFMQMPAQVRARFGNDPGEFVKFCSDEKNVDEMRKLGLAVPKKEPEPEKVMKVEVVEPAAPAAGASAAKKS